MRYALSIAILFMLPSALSRALLRNGSLEKHPGVNGSTLFHQSSVDEKQLLMIQQQLAGAWVERDRAFIESVLAPEWSARLRFTDTFIKRSGQWQAVASHATRLAR